MITFEEDILKKIKTDFLENSEKAIFLLEEALEVEEALKSNRIIRCILYLAEGTLLGLNQSINMAKKDPRDVMLCAEYEYDPINNSESRMRDFSLPFEVE